MGKHQDSGCLWRISGTSQGDGAEQIRSFSPPFSSVLIAEDHQEMSTGPAAGPILMCGPHLRLCFLEPSNASIFLCSKGDNIFSRFSTPVAPKGKRFVPDPFAVVTRSNIHSSSREAMCLGFGVVFIF